MTLRRSFILSFCAHLLLFGSALAFAQLGTGLFLPRQDGVFVSLVSLGKMQGSGAGAIRYRSKQPSIAPKASDIPDMPSEAVVQDAMPDKGRPSPEAVNGSVDASGSETGVVTANAAPGQGGGDSSIIGFITPEQWAQIEASIERNKTYPRLARERAIQGTVRLRFKVARTGAVEKLEVLESSGSEILDSASVRSVYRAAPMPYVSGWVEIPIAYVLK